MEETMLVLSRREGETIHIGDEVVVHIRHCGNNRTKIGIEAPSHVRVVRGELAAGPRGEHVLGSETGDAS